jgi:hypothetical protein
LVKRSAIISLIALSRSVINDFRDGWGELEIKTTKIQHGGEMFLEIITNVDKFKKHSMAPLEKNLHGNSFK